MTFRRVLIRRLCLDEQFDIVPMRPDNRLAKTQLLRVQLRGLLPRQSGVEIEPHGALVLIRVRGSHFLWKMVRRIVGVLAAVGRGEISADAALDPDVDVAALTAPAAGLFLEGVYYKGEQAPGPIRPLLNLD